MSQETSYDVYVKSGVDGLGRDEFGSAVAHFMDRNTFSSRESGISEHLLSQAASLRPPTRTAE